MKKLLINYLLFLLPIVFTACKKEPVEIPKETKEISVVSSLGLETKVSEREGVHNNVPFALEWQQGDIMEVAAIYGTPDSRNPLNGLMGFYGYSADKDGKSVPFTAIDNSLVWQEGSKHTFFGVYASQSAHILPEAGVLYTGYIPVAKYLDVNGGNMPFKKSTLLSNNEALLLFSSPVVVEQPQESIAMQLNYPFSVIKVHIFKDPSIGSVAIYPIKLTLSTSGANRKAISGAVNFTFNGMEIVTGPCNVYEISSSFLNNETLDYVNGAKVEGEIVEGSVQLPVANDDHSGCFSFYNIIYPTSYPEIAISSTFYYYYSQDADPQIKSFNAVIRNVEFQPNHVYHLNITLGADNKLGVVIKDGQRVVVVEQ